MSWTNKEIIASLRFPGDDFSLDVLHEALKRYDDIKKELHTSLKFSPDDIEKIEASTDKDYMLKLFALYMAAEKRDADAFPLILDFFITYEDQAWKSLGNMVPTDLGCILASVCQADTVALKTAIMRPQSSYFFHLACLDALAVLMCVGDLPRQTLIEWFRIWLRDDTLDQSERGYLVDICIFIALQELKDDVLDALKSGRTYAEDFDLEDVENMLSTSEIDETNIRQFLRIDDAVDSITECLLRNYSDILSDMFYPNEVKALMPFFKSWLGAKKTGKCMPEFLHGFVFAIALTPDSAPFDEWYPNLLDGEMPEFQSVKEATAAEKELMLLYSRLNDKLMNGTLISPFYDEGGISKDLVPMARQWCKGFYLATSLGEDYWLATTGSTGFGEAFITIIMLANENRENDFLKPLGRKPCAKERKWLLEECLAKLPYAIDILIKHAQQAADKAYDLSLRVPVHSTKVGRNAPCTCGSGKKFKKCCGKPCRSVH